MAQQNIKKKETYNVPSCDKQMESDQKASTLIYFSNFVDAFLLPQPLFFTVYYALTNNIESIPIFRCLLIVRRDFTKSSKVLLSARHNE